MRYSPKQICSECQEAAQIFDIDIEKFLEDLGRQKGKALDEQEQKYLGLSLLGKDPRDIAKEYNYEPESVRTIISGSIGSYIKSLMIEDGFLKENATDRRPSWLKIVKYAKEKYPKRNREQEKFKIIITIECSSDIVLKPITNIIGLVRKKLNHPDFTFIDIQEVKEEGDKPNEK